MPISPIEFVNRWRDVELTERSASQSHFLNLCQLVGHPEPVEADRTGEYFTFERGVSKASGGDGWADVWKRGFFAWEYKGPRKDLDKAYNQLLQYREDLENPPLLVVSDMGTIEVHTNFTNTVKKVVRLSYDDLLTSKGMEGLRAVFTNPDYFRAPLTVEYVTEEAAREFARLSAQLSHAGHDPHTIAHFLIRVLFTLFAEDVDLLPDRLFTHLIKNLRSKPGLFTTSLRTLFGVMATGGVFGEHVIRHFNGGLFDDDIVLPLDHEAMEILFTVANLDWGNIEPAIFGTLFERSLDPVKRSQLGAHYTRREDILRIVEPVVMHPLRREWKSIQKEIASQAEKLKSAKTDRIRTNRRESIRRQLLKFSDRLSQVRVLDPACGSGNFLYVTLRALLDLQKEVLVRLMDFGFTKHVPTVDPTRMCGIEINEYAHALATATVWIGWIQWLRENGFGLPEEPILQRLEIIEHRDALITTDAKGNAIETNWPAADFIVGNPPFLGDKKMKEELGADYVKRLRHVYANRVPGGADLVSYWFEKGRGLIEAGQTKRAGFIATNSIRFGANRDVIKRITDTGKIFTGWSDEPWLLDGAAVRVSFVAFDDGTEKERTLNGYAVEAINANLTSGLDLTTAQPLPENDGIVFLGMMKAGPFDIDSTTANRMLASGGNPNGRPNSEVVRPRVNGSDITGRSRSGFIIDFGTMSLEQAAEYDLPFEYVRTHVKPVRDKSNDPRMRELWWQHGRSRPALRSALRRLSRCIVTPEVAKHRVFAWLSTSTAPDHSCHVFARDDDYFFGVIHSIVHEWWSMGLCNFMGVGNDPRYNSGTIFPPFPMPFPPGQEPKGDCRVEPITEAARELVAKRHNWLSPSGVSDAELKKRTLTNLYNARPMWLQLAHRVLDKAVFRAYGWEDLVPLLTREEKREDLREEVLGRLLAINGTRYKNNDHE